jgi:UDP-3-O-acyl-N-acetylglucosamine deacetylase
MVSGKHGLILAGDENVIRRSYDLLAAQPVDQEMYGTESAEKNEMEKTIREPVSVTGPGTFLGKARRTLTFEPTREQGWWLDRQDLADSLPIRVSVNNVWTTVRNIVLRSGSPHNYMRMVEHIVALKVGMGVDNVMIRADAGDPPLFDRSSLDLVDAVERAGIVDGKNRAVYVTVKEPVTIGSPNGGFLTFLPSEGGSRKLSVDCAVHFKSAIGRQRIKFDVNRETFRYGAGARTNTTLLMMLYVKTIGRIFADVRHLGYTTKNILIAGRFWYFNRPGLVFKGKSLEAAWHRATLDLLAAVALIDRGRLAGKIISYKAGHALDVDMIRELYRRDLLVQLST